jgi:hypothetical protein
VHHTPALPSTIHMGCSLPSARREHSPLQLRWKEGWAFILVSIKAAGWLPRGTHPHLMGQDAIPICIWRRVLTSSMGQDARQLMMPDTDPANPAWLIGTGRVPSVLSFNARSTLPYTPGCGLVLAVGLG